MQRILLRSPFLLLTALPALAGFLAQPAQADPSPWKTCVRTFVPTPTLGDLAVSFACESRTIPESDPRFRAVGFFKENETGVPGRAFLLALDDTSACRDGRELRCDRERWVSVDILDPGALVRGEIVRIKRDERLRAWTFTPGAFTRSLTRMGEVIIEATPRDNPQAPPRRAEARWERSGPRVRKALLKPASSTETHGAFRIRGTDRSLAASPPLNEGCWEIPLVAVTPVKRTKRLSEGEWRRKGEACDGRSNDACLHVTLEQKVEPSAAIHGALRLVHTQGSPEVNEILPALLRSPSIRDILRLRRFVRQRTGAIDACKPIPVSIARKGEELGTGPALINGMRFELNGREYDELIAIEDASLAGQNILTMKALRIHGIDDLVIAHELAHGMMQELYGAEEFSRVTGGILSRDGHNASSTTDPALAWIEGFAEAFEAFYGLRNSGDRIDPTWAPALTEALAFIDARTKEMVAQDDFSIPYYLNFVGAILGKAGEFFGKFDLMMAELLKLERQDPIRNGFYVVSTRFGNLPVQLGVESPALAPRSMVESYEELVAREGIAAHFVYLLLRSGHERELVETIRQDRPADVVEFLNAFARLQPKAWKESGLARRTEELLTPAIRTALAEHHMNAGLHSARHDFVGAQTDAPWLMQDAALEMPGKSTALSMPLPPQRTAWIEFRTGSTLRRLLQGSMDRLDLMTAPVERLVEAFGVALESTPMENKKRAAAASRLASSWVEFRRRLLPDALESRLFGGPRAGVIRENELDAWVSEAGLADERVLRRRVVGFIHSARECQLGRCETPEI